MLTIKKIINYKLWISSTIAIVVSLVIIPIFLLFIDTTDTPKFDNAYYQKNDIRVPDGIFIKNADPVFYDFLEDVKKTNGILVLGTSETGNWLSGKNYYSLLNIDKDIDRATYSIAGAGRQANMYFPLIFNKPEAFENLEVIYYINPTYWRTDLCEFNNEYFERYVNFDLVQKTKNIAKEHNIYNDFLKLSPSYFITAFTNKLVVDYKSLFVERLNPIVIKDYVQKNKYSIIDKQKPSSENKIGIESFYTKDELENERNKINLEYNVTDDFLSHNEPFPKINTNSTYQYDLINAFIYMCIEYNIKCVFYLGPYNEVYCNKMNPELKNDYEQTIQNIKQLLINNDVEYIDGTSLSNIPGTFIDIQHISEYGAYLTALQIKDYYEKKD